MGNLLVKDFDNFLDTLRTVPLDEVAQPLRNQIERTKEDLVKVLNDTDIRAKKRALAHFSLLAMAEKASAEAEPYNPFKEESWMAVARDELRQFAAQAPDSRSNVLGTIFFDPDEDKRRRYATSVSAAVEPYGEYDNRSFIVGVALGEIAISKSKYLP